MQVAVAQAGKPGAVLEVRERVQRGWDAVVVGLGSLAESCALEGTRPGPLRSGAGAQEAGDLGEQQPEVRLGRFGPP
ncbi:Uncharacterised protein [Actinomyces viscosus]|uniref:Uncharacterized protein n=1 Tax=Actinomyces viscosus TaxID=1656 RepID=A0A448PMB4_ACTVI|nr:Uncharacterised protein [Actinomyces viscosus]